MGAYSFEHDIISGFSCGDPLDLIFQYPVLNASGGLIKSTTITGTSPMQFKSSGRDLENYIIYGASGGVGDYDSSIDAYIIPISINGFTTDLMLAAPLEDGDILTMSDTAVCLPTEKGDNVLVVGTMIAPNRIDIMGRIEAYSG